MTIPAEQPTENAKGDKHHVAPGTLSDSSPGLFRSARQTEESSDAVAQILTGRTFGNYDILEEIARGGMGVVVRARERKLKRIVALKMILGGHLADESDIQRFYVEAKAAAALQHPGIVPIYEVGDIDGQHFYSMQLVEGPSLKSHLDDGPVPPGKAASLVREIALAVQFAHEHSIIHRDLKPENILLTRDGSPMVTDFGLAKSIESGDNLTQSGQVLGTPGYMAPEQALGRIDLQGPGVDVYSLGAILYFLLTGRPPFQASSTLETLDQVVRRMPVSPRDLNPAVPRDIETVCLKCLAKDPRQRYFSAEALASDLGRFLEGRPVAARPAGPARRLWRWCLRNPSIAALSATVILCLVAGITFTTRYAMLAQRRAVESERQRQAAERNFDLARDAVDRYFTRVSEDTLLNQPGMQSLQKKLLGDALIYYQRFVGEKGNDAETREDVASALFRVGLIEEAVDSDLAISRTALKRAARLQEQILKNAPDQRSAKVALANTLTALSRIDAKARVLGDAQAAAEESLRLRLQISQSDMIDLESRRLVASSYMNLGLIYGQLGDLSTAAQTIRDAQAIREELLTEESSPQTQRDLGIGYYNLANIEKDSGDARSASVIIEKAISSLTVATQQSPEDLRNAQSLALCFQLKGDVIAGLGELPQAIEAYTVATQKLQTLSDKNPDVTDYAVNLAVARMNLGSLYQASGQLTSAEKVLLESSQQFETLLAEKLLAAHQLFLCECQFRLALVEEELGAPDKARKLLRKIISADLSEGTEKQKKQLADLAAEAADILADMSSL